MGNVTRDYWDSQYCLSNSHADTGDTFGSRNTVLDLSLENKLFVVVGVTPYIK